MKNRFLELSEHFYAQYASDLPKRREEKITII